MFEKIGEKLSGMVKIPTVSGSTDQYMIREYREYLEKVFPALFGTAEKIPVGEALLLRLKGKEKSMMPVLFTGHMDVVAAEMSPGWEYPPFSGHMENGCIWGRGTQDMKGPQCALLSAADRLVMEGWIPDRDIWFYLSCDEETGGETTKHAVQYLQEHKIRFSTVFDEGGTICEDFMGLVKGPAAMFGIAEKGSLEYRLTALSEGGHAANPPRNSAIVRLAELIHEIEGQDIFVRELSPGNRVMLRKMAEYADDKMQDLFLCASEEYGEYPVLYDICEEARILLGATIAFTKVEGGTAFNVMPKKAVLTANVRVSAVETEEAVTEKLRKIAEKHGVQCELIKGSDASRESSTEGPGYQAMEEAVKQIYPGLPVIPFVLGGGTDSKYFEKVADEAIRFSPMYAAPYQGRGVHAENESAFEGAVIKAAECYYFLLKNNCRKEECI